jgi:hypothetical protein
MIQKYRVFLSLVLVLLSLAVFSQQKELKVLFVGNSYTYGNNLPHLVSLISEGTSTRLVTRKSTIGGARLEQHWNGERELQTRELIAKGDFDIVVLQGYSMSAIHNRDTTLKYMALFAEYNREHGAETYLFNTWARERVPQFQEEIDDMYEVAAGALGAVRVPAGSAWQLALEKRPTVDLFTVDGSHPNELGCLLTACTFVKAITGELPHPLPTQYWTEDAVGESIKLMDHHPEDAEFCRRVVEELYTK